MEPAWFGPLARVMRWKAEGVRESRVVVERRPGVVPDRTVTGSASDHSEKVRGTVGLEPTSRDYKSITVRASDPAGSCWWLTAFTCSTD